MDGFGKDNNFFEVTAYTNKKLKRCPLAYDKLSNNKDTFSIVKTDIALVQKIKKVLEAIAVFKRFVSKLRDQYSKDQAHRDRETCKRMEERIDSMIYFIFDIDDKDVQNFPNTMSIEEIPCRMHQKIFKELHMVESLVDILF